MGESFCLFFVMSILEGLLRCFVATVISPYNLSNEDRPEKLVEIANLSASFAYLWSVRPIKKGEIPRDIIPQLFLLSYVDYINPD